MVYVLSKQGTPLMPTERYGKVRRMLRDGRAVAVRREPFTVQLTYDSTKFTQPVTLGIDAGTTHVGLSATTESRELFSAEVTFRTDIVKLLSQRREARHTRRNRKTRYRKPRFDNRRHAAFAPSVEQRIQSHLHLILKRNFKSLRDAAVMSIMRWELYNRAKNIWSNVYLTYGYFTKHTRISNKLEKSHAVDARCISGNPLAEPCAQQWSMRQRRRHNRQIHKANILPGGRRKLNQAPYLVRGFRLFDKVKYDGKECFVFGRRQHGNFNVRLIDGTTINADVNCRKLHFVSISRSYLLTLKREPIRFPTPFETGSTLG